MRRTRARLPGTLACTLLLLGSGCSGTREASATADADQQLSAAERPAVGRGIMLPTGVRLDPTGRSIPVGNMPLSALPAPDNRHLFLLLSGWREEGLQVVDVAAGRVTQTLKQAGAFVGLAMTRDGRSLYTSGGGADMVYRYDWRDGRATLADSIDLSATGERRGARHIAGIALSPDGTRLYAVENLSDSLAVIDLS
ncbi:MAG: beta-propeller fold lactonase family protein, partial [bacterium]